MQSVYKMSSVKPVENFLKKNLQSELYKIVVECGYNTKSAILLISLESIKEIEAYINENKDILKDTIYEPFILNGKIFKLKPGHKSVILNLPELLRSKEQTSKPKKKSSIQREKNNNVDDEIRDSSDEIEEKLKCALIKKLENFSSKFDFCLTFDIACISYFETTSDKISCKFECPICNTKIKCEYRSYWLVSNLENHLKKHYRIEVLEVEDKTEIVSHGLEQYDEIEKILND